MIAAPLTAKFRKDQLARVGRHIDKLWIEVQELTKSSLFTEEEKAIFKEAFKFINEADECLKETVGVEDGD